MNYSTRFIDREKLGGGVVLFRFEKPLGFLFIAGQYCLVSVPEIGFRDDRGLRRPFSIASSPLEENLLFVTKLSDSAFKRTMAAMAPGTVVTLDGPRGSLTLPDEGGAPLVFLAGGIGVVPFRSLCRYATDAKTTHSITLFYSSRTPEEAPFLDELQRMPEQNRRLKAVITMTRSGDDAGRWTGLTGRLSAEMIKGNCEYWEGAEYYIAGPPAMAETMKKILEEMRIPGGRIKIELFTGY